MMCSVGSVEGVPFTACISGRDIIILASNFSRIQQITSNSPVSSLDCSTDVGKIAAAYDNKIVIYEPIPVASGTSKLDYKWVQTATIESETNISVISFNLEGTRLIAGGQSLEMWVIESKTNWQCVWRCRTASIVSYLKFSPDGTLFCSAGESDRLVKIWYESVTNTPSLSVSNTNVNNDFTSATTLSTPNCLSPPPAFNGSAPIFSVASNNNQLDGFNRQKYEFSFIYVAHPLPVTSLEWRRTSKYTPRGAVANILITSCKDNIARIWVQTLLPDDGLVNFNQLKGNNCEGDLVSGAPPVQTQRHRQKLLRRLKRMKAFSQFKKRQALALDHSIDELEKVATANPTIATTIIHSEHYESSNTSVIHQSQHQINGGLASSHNNSSSNNILNTSLPTALSAHDFHSYALCSTVIKPGLHFHLAGIIEGEIELSNKNKVSIRDLQRSDTIASTIDQQQLEEDDISSQFVVHWINNKEIHITRSIELLLHDMLLRILKNNNPAASSTNSPQSAGESCSGSENDTDDTEDPNDDTITAESSKKLRHKLCRKMNKQRALAASGRRDPGDSDDSSHLNSNRTSMNATNNNNTVSGNTNGRASPTSLVEEFDKTLESLLKKWQMSTDLLFSVNKKDGTLTIWQVKYLDGEEPGVFRQVQIDKLSHLKSALPHYDAITMSLDVIAYSPSAYLDVKRAYLAVTNSSGLASSGNTANFIVGEQFSQVDVPEILSINTDSNSISNKPEATSLTEIKDSVSSSSLTDSEPSIFIVTQHLSGILGLWKFNFDSNYPRVQSVDLVTRITGLPIDPAWLRDGILIVEYLDKESSLITRWFADDNGRKLVRTSSRIPHSPSCKSNNHSSFREIESSGHHLPSVDEEVASKPLQLAGMKRSSQDSRSMDMKDSYRVSEMAGNINILPQYHLKQLIELLAFGKLQRVKAILNHLVNCLVSFESSREKDFDTTKSAPWAHRSRTLSIVAQSAQSFHDSFDIDNPSSNIQQQVVEEIELDYIEVTSIKPLPLYSLLNADVERPTKEIDSKAATREEFSVSYESIMKARSQVDETLDEILGQSTIETLNKQKENLKRMAKDGSDKGMLTNFNPKKAKLLTRVLTHTHLPGLSNIDQMHLLAVADAVALFDASPDDYNDIQDEDYDGSQGGGLSMMSTNIAIDSLDDRGLRFLTAMRQHIYLTRCLPMKQRNELKASGIGNHNLVWAFHSESQDELISLIPCVQRNKPEWSELREFGIGWWLKKLEVLRKLIEKVAQSAYQARQDPLDAALFYLAMKKKTLVCALLRRVNCDKRLLKLFEQDFNDPVNRKKALKNAYALLGLHRFEHAAAFFILAGSIWDAVEVCINNLNDIQLAIVLIRLYDNDTNLPYNLKKLLFTEILGSKRPTTQEHNNQSSSQTSQQQSATIQSNVVIANNIRSSSHQLDRRTSITNSMTGLQYQYDPKRAHQDPFLRSMAFWKLGDYLSSVHTLLENDVGQQQQQIASINAALPSQRSFQQNSSNNSRRNSDSINNSVSTGSFSQQLLDGGQLSPTNRGNVSVSASVFNFYLFLKDQTLVVKHKQQLLEEVEIKKRTSPVEEEHVHCHRARSLSSGELGFDECGISRAVKQSSTEFEVLNETTRLVDKYSDQAIAEKERRLFFSTANAYLEAGCPLLALEVLCSEDHLNMSKAQRMKFVACLHILMNELNTLASPSSAAASQHSDHQQHHQKFGNQFFEWLQQSVDAIKVICSYTGVVGLAMAAALSPSYSGEQNVAEDDCRQHIAEVEEEVETDQSMQELPSSRSQVVVGDMTWVKMNEPILRAMLTYCNLHSATVNSLTTVRLELLNLLKRF